LIVAAINRIAMASGQGTKPPLIASGISERQRILARGFPFTGPLGMDPGREGLWMWGGPISSIG